MLSPQNKTRDLKRRYFGRIWGQNNTGPHWLRWFLKYFLCVFTEDRKSYRHEIWWVNVLMIWCFQCNSYESTVLSPDNSLPNLIPLDFSKPSWVTGSRGLFSTAVRFSEPQWFTQVLWVSLMQTHLQREQTSPFTLHLCSESLALSVTRIQAEIDRIQAGLHQGEADFSFFLQMFFILRTSDHHRAGSVHVIGGCCCLVHQRGSSWAQMLVLEACTLLLH